MICAIRLNHILIQNLPLHSIGLLPGSSVNENVTKRLQDILWLDESLDSVEEHFWPTNQTVLIYNKNVLCLCVAFYCPARESSFTVPPFVFQQILYITVKVEDRDSINANDPMGKIRKIFTRLPSPDERSAKWNHIDFEFSYQTYDICQI